jgi:hypothetical protein
MGEENNVGISCKIEVISFHLSKVFCILIDLVHTHTHRDRDKHSSLLQNFVNYGHKKFYRALYCKTLRICNLRENDKFSGLYLKLFTVVINSVVQKAGAFAIFSHFLLALTNAPAFYVSFIIQAPVVC